MLELRGAVAHRQLGRHAQPGQFLALEGVGVDVGVAGQVQLHVDQRRGQVFGDIEALAEGPGLVDLVDQDLRQRLAGLIVQGKAVQHLRRGQPVLVHLAGELHIVAEHPRARERRVGDVRVQAVQGVAEFVEHGLGVVEGDQQRLAGRRFHEVGVVGDDAGDLAAIGPLGAVGVHPGAGTLAGPRIGIKVPQADVLAPALHLIDRHVRVLHRDVGCRREREAVELAGGPVHAVAQLVHLQIRLHRVEIEVVAGGPHLLGIVAVVPGGDLDAGALLVGDRLHLGDLLADAGDGRGPDAQHQRHRRLGRPGHGVVGQPPVRMGREAQQSGALGAQFQDPPDDGVVVAGIAVVAAVVEGPPDLLAQVATVGIGQERVDRGAGVEHRIFAGMLPLGRRGAGRGAHVARQARQVRRVQEQGIVVLVGQQVLVEGREVAGQLEVDRRQPLLGLRAEPGAAPHEGVPTDGHQPLLLRRQPGPFAGQVNRVDALEQLLVLQDLVAVRRQPGLDRPVDRAQLRRRERAAPDGVQGRGPVARRAGLFQRAQGVVEGGRGRVAGDRLDLGQFGGHGRLQGGREVGHPDLVERRHAAIGPRPRRQQRVGRLGVGGQDAARGGGGGSGEEGAPAHKDSGRLGPIRRT